MTTPADTEFFFAAKIRSEVRNNNGRQKKSHKSRKQNGIQVYGEIVGK